ncbi:GNAT family N-acetyltransferase [Pseudotenacibaculum sp. MALMAid0570]|uniref:GNAT family N-acetyltransferase n=1 Tax=Pseudotenacibaculum sp. MALMAid0570 TaxID=3143938 RepID=UPI0032DF22C6
MIKYIDRDSLDDKKYDACIEESHQSLLYAYSWYLDTAVENWGVFILNDYEAVMPVPFRQKYLIKYVYPPLWILQLGIFSRIKKIHEDDFICELKNKFNYVESRMNYGNSVANQPLKYFQKLDLNKNHTSVRELYQKDRRKDLNKAQKNELTAKWTNNEEVLIELFKNNVGKRIPTIKERDYLSLKALIKLSIKKDVGELLNVYDKDQLVASAFFLKHKGEVTILCSSTDFSNRKNGANTFLIDKAIEKYCKEFTTFNFGGSSMSSVAKYFFSFGATQVEYPFLKMNNLPFLLRFLKS